MSESKMQSSMTLSVMLTTKNRLQDLRRTCDVLRRLVPRPLEILITADGCQDGTVDFVMREIPEARLFVNQPGLGSVASRDLMMRQAKGELVLALDDDSYPEQLDFIARVIPLFIERPQLGVAHFPQRTDEYPETLTQFEFESAHFTRSFANSGAVIRRSIYLELPGFEAKFFHMYEEPDYALQCVASGYEVYYSPVATIRHHFSGQVRNEVRNHHRHSRNEFWSTLMRCPFPHVIALAGYRVLSQFRYACSRGANWVIKEPQWWWEGMLGIPYCLKNRRAVSWSRFKVWLSLP